MNREHIQQKFNEILKGLGWTFSDSGVLKERYTLQENVEELMEKCFNLGLEVASNVAMIEEEIPEEERDSEWEESPSVHSGGFIRNEHRVQVNKDSILQHKL